MGTKEKTKICLCMIVKNEEAVLARCLESVRGAVDEIVVVDTGSTDRTKEIAAEFGARVYEHAWQNSFSEARNYALKFVNSEWVLQLDADEQLEKEDIKDLRRVVQSDQYHAVFLSILNFQPQGRTQLYYPRLFRRGKAHYEGIVHNQLHYVGKPLLSNIRIYHYGYNLSPEKMAAKWERSTKLLEQQIEENPQDEFAWYNLIRMYRNRRRFDLAARQGKRVLKELSFEGKESLYLMIAYDTASSFLELGEYREAESYCQRALERDPDYIDVIFTLGVIYMKIQRHPKAIQFFSEFLDTLQKLNTHPKLHLMSLGTIDYDYLACTMIGDCYFEMGKTEEALNYYRKSLELYTAKEEILEKGASPHKDILMQLGNASVRVGDINRAENFYEAYLHEDAKNPQVLNNLGCCCVQKKKIDAAIRLFRAALEINPYYEEAKKNLRVLLKQKKNKPLPPEPAISAS